MTPDTSSCLPSDTNGGTEIRLSKHTERVGTQLYMSPEQLAGKHYDYKVDIYSLGFILFELLVVFGTEMERIETLKALRVHEFPSGFSTCFPNEVCLYVYVCKYVDNIMMIYRFFFAVQPIKVNALATAK